MPDVISTITSFAGQSLAGRAVFRTTLQILASTDETGSTLVDITTLFPPIELLAFDYEDNISFQSDNLQLHCPDIGDRIINNPQIEKGNWLQLIIHQFNKEYPGSHVSRDCGTFQIDAIKQIGPPTQTTIMATSVPISVHIKLTKKNQMSFTTDLKSYGQQVATEQGLGYSWLVPDYKNAVLSEVNQWNETDLEYLARLCRSHGFAMKIANKTLIIFDEQTEENKPPIYTIDFSKKGAGINMETWELTTQSQDIYSQATINMYDPDSGDNTEATVPASQIGSDAKGSGEIYKRFEGVYPPPKTEQEEISGGTP